MRRRKADRINCMSQLKDKEKEKLNEIRKNQKQSKKLKKKEILKLCEEKKALSLLQSVSNFDQTKEYHPIFTEMNKEQTNAIFISNLSKRITLELIFLEFKQYGRIQSIIFSKQKFQSAVIFESESEANAAIQQGNHSQIFSKALISRFDAPEEQSLNQTFNLLIKNVPENLDSNELQSYLNGKFGNVVSLFLKKSEDGKNKGFGYIQFGNKESLNQILEFQAKQRNVCITLPSDSNYSFTVEPFGTPPKSLSQVKVMGIFESLVPINEVTAKGAQLESILKVILEESKGLTAENIFMKYFFEYKESKANFFAHIEFSTTDEEIEEKVQIFIKNKLRLSFGSTPEIVFKSVFSNERNIIILGLKEHVTNKIMVDWIAKYHSITLQESNIRISTPLPKGNKPRKFAHECQISFDECEQGVKLMIFAAKQANFKVLSEITEEVRKITIYLPKNEVLQIKNQERKMKDLYEGKNSASHYFPSNPFLSNNNNNNIPGQHSKQFPQSMPSNIPSLPPQFQNHNVPFQINSQYQMQGAAAATSLSSQDNIFNRFIELSIEEKAQQVDMYAEYLNSRKADFSKVKDKPKLLRQVMYYKIMNFDRITNPKQFDAFKGVSHDQAINRLKLFKAQVDSIIPLLTDLKIFKVADIIGMLTNEQVLVLNCKQLIEMQQKSIVPKTNAVSAAAP